MNMPRNGFKAALAKDATQYGIWAGFASGYAAEIVASLGYDWMLIDGEHAPNTVPSVLNQLQTVAPYSTAPVVRARFLDGGGGAAAETFSLDSPPISPVSPARVTDSATKAQTPIILDWDDTLLPSRIATRCMQPRGPTLGPPKRTEVLWLAEGHADILQRPRRHGIRRSFHLR